LNTAWCTLQSICLHSTARYSTNTTQPERRKMWFNASGSKKRKALLPLYSAVAPQTNQTGNRNISSSDSASTEEKTPPPSYEDPPKYSGPHDVEPPPYSKATSTPSEPLLSRPERVDQLLHSLQAAERSISLTVLERTSCLTGLMSQGRSSRISLL
jgi:hypothetical protein